MSMRPPDSARIRSATRSADMPGPGRRFGHDVTIFHFTFCARAMDGIATLPASPAPAAMALRRGILLIVSSPVRVKMMQRAAAVADLQFVGRGDGGGDVIFGRSYRFDQRKTF